MGISDIATLPSRLAAAARRGAGVLAEGLLERVAQPGEGLPMTSCDVIGRVSKRVGLPGGVPDVAGLAWRIPPPQDLSSCGPWDVVLSSTLSGSRLIAAPATSWRHATFSSVMPLRYDGSVWWLRARLAGDIAAPGLALAKLKGEIDSHGIEFDIEQAVGAGAFRPLAHLTLRHVDPTQDDIAFDHALHSHCDVIPARRWLARVSG